MKVICTQENLKNGLQVVSRIIGNSTTLPVLNNVKLETENGLLKISGTNLEIGISTLIRCKVESEGAVCVNFKLFADLITSLANQPVELQIEDNQLLVSTQSTHTKLNFLPPDEFPIIPQVENPKTITVSAADFKNAIDQVIYAASASETQPEISGMLLWFGSEKVLCTATDRFRLAEKSIAYQGDGTTEKKIIVPQKSVLELSRLLTGVSQDLTVLISDTQLAVTLEDTYLVSRLIDGEYPPYQQIIPDRHITMVALEKQALLNAIRTSSVFSSRTGSIVFNFDEEQNLFQVNAVSNDLGESTIDIPAQIQGPSGVLIINYRYVLDFLNHFAGNEVIIKIIDDDNPVVFVSPDDNSFLYLVMPIKQ